MSWDGPFLGRRAPTPFISQLASIWLFSCFTLYHFLFLPACRFKVVWLAVIVCCIMYSSQCVVSRRAPLLCLSGCVFVLPPPPLLYVSVLVIWPRWGGIWPCVDIWRPVQNVCWGMQCCLWWPLYAFSPSGRAGRIYLLCGRLGPCQWYPIWDLDLSLSHSPRYGVRGWWRCGVFRGGKRMCGSCICFWSSQCCLCMFLVHLL